MRRRSAAIAVLAVLAVATALALASPPAAAASDVTDIDTAEAADAEGDEVNFTVELPKTVAANVTQAYSIDLSSANGSVNATWQFPNATKRGTTVEHAFAKGGNVTFTVTVTDESGASATREVTVQVVDYRDDDDGGAGSDFEQFFGAVAVIFLVLGVFPVAMYLFVLPTVMEHVTDAFE